MNDPRDALANNATEPSTDVDEFASRLLDGDIVMADVPPALRDDVTRRRETFARQRLALGDITGSASQDTIERSVDRALTAYRRQRMVRRPRVIGVAAAAASILVLAGLGFTRIGSDEPLTVADGGAAVMVASDTVSPSVSEATKMDPLAAAAAPSLALSPEDTIVEFESADELRVLVDGWSVDVMRQEFPHEDTSSQSMSAPCSSEPTAQLLTRNARFRGQPVEIYRADTGDIIVYAQTDCAVLLRLGA